jgi:hypothetical protein
MQNVAAVPVNKIGNRGVQPFAVGTLNQQNRRISQNLSLLHEDACGEGDLTRLLPQA